MDAKQYHEKEIVTAPYKSGFFPVYTVLQEKYKLNVETFLKRNTL